ISDLRSGLRKPTESSQIRSRIHDLSQHPPLPWTSLSMGTRARPLPRPPAVTTPSIERRETRCRPPILRKPDLGLTICLVDPSESSRERVERRHHPLTRESTYNRQMTRLATGIELWRAAGHWRRHVEAALKPMGLSYNQFLIMHYIDVLLRQTKD